MPETNYGYTKSNVDSSRLHQEIKDDASIATTLISVKFAEPDQLTIRMADAISGAEQTALDNVVTNHPAAGSEIRLVAEAASSDMTSTTSLSFVDLNIMTVTPGKGNYFVIFTGSMKHDTRGASVGIRISANGVELHKITTTPSAELTMVTIHAYIHDLQDGQNIGVQWKTDVGTITMVDRIMCVLNAL